jgi:hypothetical protein
MCGLDCPDLSGGAGGGRCTEQEGPAAGRPRGQPMLSTQKALNRASCCGGCVTSRRVLP